MLSTSGCQYLCKHQHSILSSVLMCKGILRKGFPLTSKVGCVFNKSYKKNRVTTLAPAVTHGNLEGIESHIRLQRESNLWGRGDSSSSR